ncbi:MAG: hypothetical protein ACMG5Z_08175 [Luteimonas sp.]
MNKFFIKVLGSFLVLSTAMAFLAGLSLLFHGSILDKMWVVNPDAYMQLMPYSQIAGIGFMFLAPMLTITGYGLFKLKKWGWYMGTGIISLNALGDLANLFRGEILKGTTSFIIAGIILWFLLKKSTRKIFSK